MSPCADCLPAEVLVKIFSYLPCEDLVDSVQFVCTWWQQVSWVKQLWKFVVYQPDGGYKNVIQMLKLSPQLRILNLIFATVDNDLIHFITDSCPNLEHLHITWDSIYNNSDVAITRPVSQIKMLRLSWCKGPSLDFPYLDSAFPNLESLSIAQLRFNNKAFEHYLQKKQNTLHTLSIPCCTADDLSVLPCLSACTNLRNLCLYKVCNKVWSWKGAGYFPNISRLTLYCGDMSNVNDSSPLFGSFPNITELVLEFCEPSKKFFSIISRNCPQLQKLMLTLGNGLFAEEGLLIRDTLRALHLERLAHLYIDGNEFLTDEGIKHILWLMPGLIYLDLYHCKLLTTGCLKFICGMNKLEVLKFDLSNKPLLELKACDVKNKNLQLMVYNCPDDSCLDTLRQQHLRVCVTNYSICRLFFDDTRSSWFIHCCFWCS
ncbi:F-box/LRR-repeat protein 2-like isoform X2 [Anabrus simplex]